MGKLSRDKGQRFERLVSKLMQPFWPEAKRGFQSRNGGDAPDVDGTPYWIECKAGARPNLFAAYEQAVEASDGRPPLLVLKKDHGPVFVAMPWLVFEHLLTPAEETP